VKSVTVLGSTGAIGTRTLQVLKSLKSEFYIEYLAAGQRVEELARQILEFQPKAVSVATNEARNRLTDILGAFSGNLDVLVGDSGLEEIAQRSSDIVVSAIVGAKGLVPTWKAIERGATIALANKETLVIAGDLVMPLAHRHSSKLIPVDSEHSAIMQSLAMSNSDEVRRFVITASGGPFRGYTMAELENATVQQALKHPNWQMGQKITIDSATLMNKGLEVIEAHHLFDVPYDMIDVIVHPQSVVHSMVEYVDGAVVAQLATHDMRLPIQYALTYPRRVQQPWPRLNLLECGMLSFEPPDMVRFPCLRIAYEAGRAGGFAPCVLNAANEVAVQAFLDGKLGFLGISHLVESTLSQLVQGQPSSLEDILAMDDWARQVAHTLLRKGGWSA